MKGDKNNKGVGIGQGAKKPSPRVPSNTNKEEGNKPSKPKNTKTPPSQ